MDRLECMRVFLRVAELASFTAAADSLGLPKASVSTAVRSLETQLGTHLLHRTTRRVRLTQDGETFYERCAGLLTEVEAATSMFQQAPSEIRGRLRVDMPVGVASSLVIPRLPEFLDTHPAVQVELSTTDRRMDLIREGFDCVVRVGTLENSNLVARPLGALRIINCASPAYLQHHGEPQGPSDMPNHRLVHYVQTLGKRPEGWEYYDGKRYCSIAVPGVITVNSAAAYQAACLAGLGIIQVPEVGVRSEIEAGRLVEVLSDYPVEPMPVNLLYATRRNLPRRLQVFMDWLSELMTEYVGEEFARA